MKYRYISYSTASSARNDYLFLWHTHLKVKEAFSFK